MADKHKRRKFGCRKRRFLGNQHSSVSPGSTALAAKSAEASKDSEETRASASSSKLEHLSSGLLSELRWAFARLASASAAGTADPDASGSDSTDNDSDSTDDDYDSTADDSDSSASLNQSNNTFGTAWSSSMSSNTPSMPLPAANSARRGQLS